MSKSPRYLSRGSFAQDSRTFGSGLFLVECNIATTEARSDHLRLQAGRIATAVEFRMDSAARLGLAKQWLRSRAVWSTFAFFSADLAALPHNARTLFPRRAQRRSMPPLLQPRAAPATASADAALKLLPPNLQSWSHPKRKNTRFPKTS